MSKEMRVPPHKHCIVCGKATSENQEFCSNKCKEEYTKRERRYKMTTRVTYLLFIVIIIVFVIISLAGKAL
jgi:predicted nucleic acid-binding Zn ribbon protein